MNKGIEYGHTAFAQTQNSMAKLVFKLLHLLYGATLYLRLTYPGAADP